MEVAALVFTSSDRKSRAGRAVQTKEWAMVETAQGIRDRKTLCKRCSKDLRDFLTSHLLLQRQVWMVAPQVTC